MNNYDIFTVEDVFNMLDAKLQDQRERWESFYSQRNFKAPFINHPDLPDENLKDFFSKFERIPNTVLELGCGEGRNAIFMAKQGSNVIGVDLSESAIKNAQMQANKNNVKVNFQCKSIFEFKNMNFDFIYDSGCFHHLPPHRRITYLELLRSSLKPGSYFGLACFSTEVDSEEYTDWDYYERHITGTGFSKEKLEKIFSDDFEIIEIRKYRDGVPDTLQGLSFLWTALFKRK
ncbi:class I SAM-dependent methyltransferase [Clostridium paridis]|uniref:Class I SAM-dependent methyltransferase n=1 Tax=Clostridium paridis TaxID=2803863 RepID=A0A937FF00_9CLOT|nr:class I SAM-dependent methyltransferase [Clostridium paridis]MBL4931973.1 class I SAM-dependent methyltransferase [Clostridium paridis]